MALAQKLQNEDNVNFQQHEGENMQPNPLEQVKNKGRNFPVSSILYDSKPPSKSEKKGNDCVIQ